MDSVQLETQSTAVQKIFNDAADMLAKQGCLENCLTNWRSDQVPEPVSIQYNNESIDKYLPRTIMDIAYEDIKRTAFNLPSCGCWLRSNINRNMSHAILHTTKAQKLKIF